MLYLLTTLMLFSGCCLDDIVLEETQESCTLEHFTQQVTQLSSLSVEGHFHMHFNGKQLPRLKFVWKKIDPQQYEIRISSWGIRICALHKTKSGLLLERYSKPTLTAEEEATLLPQLPEEEIEIMRLLLELLTHGTRWLLGALPGGECAYDTDASGLLLTQCCTQNAQLEYHTYTSHHHPIAHDLPQQLTLRSKTSHIEIHITHHKFGPQHEALPLTCKN